MLTCFIAQLAFAEVPQAEPARPQEIQTAEASRDARVEVTDAIRYEREALERQADRQMQGVQDLLQLSLTALGIIVTVGGLLAGWFLWSTRRELRETIEKTINSQVETLVTSQAGAVRDRLRAIEEDLERLAGANARSIVWVTRDDTEAGGDVVAALRASGVSAISAVVPAVGEPFDTGNPDLVIVSYDADAESSRRLQVVLGQLQGRSPPVPLIVYTFNPAGEPYRIDGPDAEVLSRYAWYVPTNFPLQLLAQVLSLLRRVPLAGPR
ncbi:MAG: hypothetical protein WBO04_03310 [Steroidobacteraceae bacterium]